VDCCRWRIPWTRVVSSEHHVTCPILSGAPALASSPLVVAAPPNLLPLKVRNEVSSCAAASTEPQTDSGVLGEARATSRGQARPLFFRFGPSVGEPARGGGEDPARVGVTWRSGAQWEATGRNRRPRLCSMLLVWNKRPRLYPTDDPGLTPSIQTPKAPNRSATSETVPYIIRKKILPVSMLVWY
jgi:hypothetical protein